MKEVRFACELVSATLFNKLETLVHFSLKAHVKHTVGFVNNQVLKAR
jgi:hypothetical protein